VFTVAESEGIAHDIPGLHCRNLFLRDSKKRNFLLILSNDTAVEIQKLPPLIGSDRLSFGSPERLWQYLGVRPGSVCPFSIVNDTGKDVAIFLDRAMMESDLVCYHPMVNTMTVGITPDALIRFVENCGHVPHIVDFAPAAP